MFPLGSGSARLDRGACHWTRVRWLTLGLWRAPLAGTVMKDGRLWSVSAPGIMDRLGGRRTNEKDAHWYGIAWSVISGNLPRIALRYPEN